jgi:DNA-directed RNA polymerase subunit RPC12/RpoP
MSEDKRPYTIYHVVEIKVGCTRNFDRRVKQNKEMYGENVQIEILETLSHLAGTKHAGDREHWWADHFGYPRANHYTQKWDSSLTQEQLSEYGREGGRKRGEVLKDLTSEQRKQLGIGFENNDYNKSEKKKKDARRAAIIAWSQEKLGTQTQVRCPHCKAFGQTAVMHRWHFDNCKKNPNASVDRAAQMKSLTQTIQCPHCGKEGQIGPMKRHIGTCNKIDQSLGA